MNERALILDALVSWQERDARFSGGGVLLDLQIETACSECGGSTFCPHGCPMHTCRIDKEVRWPHQAYEPIRVTEYVRNEEGTFDPVLVSGKECEGCTIYGTCMSCGPGGAGKERRAVRKQSGAYLIDRQSHLAYSEAGFQMAPDPIRVTVAQVQREIDSQGEENLFTAAGIATPCP